MIWKPDMDVKPVNPLRVAAAATVLGFLVFGFMWLALPDAWWVR